MVAVGSASASRRRARRSGDCSHSRVGDSDEDEGGDVKELRLVAVGDLAGEGLDGGLGGDALLRRLGLEPSDSHPFVTSGRGGGPQAVSVTNATPGIALHVQLTGAPGFRAVPHDFVLAAGERREVAVSLQPGRLGPFNDALAVCASFVPAHRLYPSTRREAPLLSHTPVHKELPDDTRGPRAAVPVATAIPNRSLRAS